MNDESLPGGAAPESRTMPAKRRNVSAATVGCGPDDDNVLLRPVRDRQGGNGPLVGHLVTAKEVWNLLPRTCEPAANALLTVLTVQRWLTDPRDQRMEPDARRLEARRLALGLAQRRCMTGGEI